MERAWRGERKLITQQKVSLYTSVTRIRGLRGPGFERPRCLVVGLEVLHIRRSENDRRTLRTRHDHGSFVIRCTLAGLIANDRGNSQWTVSRFGSGMHGVCILTRLEAFLCLSAASVSGYSLRELALCKRTKKHRRRRFRNERHIQLLEHCMTIKAQNVSGCTCARRG